MHSKLSIFMTGLLLAQPALAADSQSKAERDRQLHEIVFQNYPPRALAAGEDGSVFFRAKLDKDASPISCEVTHGSGHPLLDAETCKLIVQHAVFKSARNASGQIIEETVEGVVNWTIPGHTPPPIRPVALAANDRPEKQICKKTLRAGTLSSFERTCMSFSEWAKQSDQQKEVWGDVQGKKGASVCGANPGAVALATQEGVSAAPPPSC